MGLPLTLEITKKKGFRSFEWLMNKKRGNDEKQWTKKRHMYNYSNIRPK
jgi:hypothetical protein